MTRVGSVLIDTQPISPSHALQCKASYASYVRPLGSCLVREECDGRDGTVAVEVTSNATATGM